MLDAKPTVAVIGAGIAGLTAAHELCVRGFDVTVFEQRGRDHIGGKARTWPVRTENELPDPEALPAEHGFRFFPGFYKHVIDTMERIPTTTKWCVEGHLVEADSALITDGEGRRLLVRLPTSQTPQPSWCLRWQGAKPFRDSFPGRWESLCFLTALARLATSCEKRWSTQLEHMSWLDYVMPPQRPRSERYRRLFAVGLTRTFVATRAEEMSARTGGKILLQMLYDTFIGPPRRAPADRVLDGPTSDVWIQPWVKFLENKDLEEPQLDRPKLEKVGLGALERQPVKFKTGQWVECLLLDSCGCVKELILRDNVKKDGFDYYVLAVPCEVLKRLLVATPGLAARDRRLARVFLLETRWMSGLVYGIKDKLDTLPKGHVLCLDSPWALTAVDHGSFWESGHLEKRRRWSTILSVDISDWRTPGGGGVPGEWVMPPRPQIAEEVWRQLQAHLPELKKVPVGPHGFPTDSVLDVNVKHGGKHTLRKRPKAEPRTNDEPLLVNTAGSWENRPGPSTKIPNLFVAGDYVQTQTDFASMEAANEAARLAVNALLETRGSDAPPCRTWPLEEPDIPWFAGPQRLAQRADEVMFRLRLRAPFRLPIVAWITLYVLSRPPVLLGRLLVLLGRLPPSRAAS